MDTYWQKDELSLLVAADSMSGIYVISRALWQVTEKINALKSTYATEILTLLRSKLKIKTKQSEGEIQGRALWKVEEN